MAEIYLVNCLKVIVTGPYTWLVNIGLGNNLVAMFLSYGITSHGDVKSMCELMA